MDSIAVHTLGWLGSVGVATGGVIPGINGIIPGAKPGIPGIIGNGGNPGIIPGGGIPIIPAMAIMGFIIDIADVAEVDEVPEVPLVVGSTGEEPVVLFVGGLDSLFELSVALDGSLVSFDSFRSSDWFEGFASLELASFSSFSSTSE